MYDAEYIHGIPRIKYFHLSLHTINSIKTGVKLVKLVSVYLPEPYVNAIDELVRENYYISRGEIIRTAIRELMRHEAEKTIHSNDDEPIPVYG